jgi:hypothetical protein
MPVRVYDISKKLGLENKEVIAKAKELGLFAVRVASSSLDRITAEYLEEQLCRVHPELNAPAPALTALSNPSETSRPTLNPITPSAESRPVFVPQA